MDDVVRNLPEEVAQAVPEKITQLPQDEVEEAIWEVTDGPLQEDQ